MRKEQSNKLLSASAMLLRIPRSSLLILLILAAGVAEAFGLSILIPLVTTLTDDSLDNLPRVYSYLPKIFHGTTGYLPLLLITLLAMLFAYFLLYTSERFSALSKAELLMSLRDNLSAAVFRSEWETHNTISTGDYVNHVMTEADRCVEAHYAVIQMFSLVIQVSVYAGLALILSWQMVIFSSAVVLSVGLLGKRLIRKTRIYGESLTALNDKLSSRSVDYMKAAKSIKSVAKEETFIGRLAELSFESARTMRLIVNNQARMRWETQSLVSIAIVVIMFFAVKVLMLELSIILLLLYSILRIIPKFLTFQNQYHIYTAFHPAANKILKKIEYFEQNRERRKIEDIKIKTISKSVIFDRVSYRYPDSEIDVIRDVSLTINAGEMVALVGPSGGGKSTILDLLVALISPTRGQIIIDDIDSVSIDVKSYRNRLGFVTQDPVLFSGSIRDNVGYFGDVDEDVLWWALDLAQLGDFVRGLPKGLDFDLGESGDKVSGGQRQRLSIARALINRPTLLVLDEATSALDSKAESRFQLALEEISKYTTIVVVAHRLSTVRRADRIYLIDRGTVVEEGSFDALSGAEGAFSSMLKAQEIRD